MSGPKQVINVRFDNAGYNQTISRPDHLTPEMYHIKPHEVLITRKVPTRGSRDRIGYVQSWCTEDEDAFDREYRFAGVAETSQDADHRPSLQQGLAMCVGGMVKAYNESGTIINVGDELTYGPNHGRTCQQGIPSRKRRVTFIKYDKNNGTHVRRGIVARAESGARNMEEFDAHVFANAQYCGHGLPSVAEIYAVYNNTEFGQAETDWNDITTPVPNIFRVLANQPDLFLNQVERLHGEKARAVAERRLA